MDQSAGGKYPPLPDTFGKAELHLAKDCKCAVWNLWLSAGKAVFMEEVDILSDDSKLGGE